MVLASCVCFFGRFDIHRCQNNESTTLALQQLKGIHFPRQSSKANIMTTEGLNTRRLLCCDRGKLRSNALSLHSCLALGQYSVISLISIIYALVIHTVEHGINSTYEHADTKAKSPTSHSVVTTVAGFCTVYG